VVRLPKQNSCEHFSTFVMKMQEETSISSSVLQSHTGQMWCRSVFQCVAVSCSVLQCAAVCCSGEHIRSTSNQSSELCQMAHIPTTKVHELSSQDSLSCFLRGILLCFLPYFFGKMAIFEKTKSLKESTRIAISR